MVVVKAITRGPMRWTVCSAEISVSLVPLLVPELPLLLLLVFP
jgi:hypothetical protein